MRTIESRRGAPREYSPYGNAECAVARSVVQWTARSSYATATLASRALLAKQAQACLQQVCRLTVTYVRSRSAHRIRKLPLLVRQLPCSDGSIDSQWVTAQVADIVEVHSTGHPSRCTQVCTVRPRPYRSPSARTASALCCTVCAAWCMVHGVWCVRCTVCGVCCMLHAARCMLSCCMLHVACLAGRTDVAHHPLGQRCIGWRCADRGTLCRSIGY